MATGAVIAGKIATDAVTAAKLAAINLEVGKYIRSTSYTAGSSGWSINAGGDAEFNNVTVRGTLDGVTGTFAGSLSAASGTFAGSLSAADGTFEGTVRIQDTINDIEFYDSLGNLEGSISAHSAGVDINVGALSPAVRFSSTTASFNITGDFGTVDTSTLILNGSTVQIGPAGSGPGGSGRALYVP
jgi:hypothetical protein